MYLLVACLKVLLAAIQKNKKQKNPTEKDSDKMWQAAVCTGTANLGDPLSQDRDTT